MSNINEYVLGFCFNDSKTEVILTKETSKWAVWVNGIAGNIKDCDDSCYSAMVRSFEEQTGVITTENMWKVFCSIESSQSRPFQIDYGNRGADAESRLWCLCLEDTEIFKEVISKNDKSSDNKEIIRYRTSNIAETIYNNSKNVAWLVPMAVEVKKNYTSDFLQVREMFLVTDKAGVKK